MFSTLVSVALATTCLAGNAIAFPRGGGDCKATSNYGGWKSIKHAFIFGDSYTTTGFNTSLTKPAPGNPLGNPAYPGWTAANGPNWADFLTVKYNNSLVLTYNLAYGGATVDSALVAPYLPTVQSLAQQIENWWFPNYAEQTNAAWTSEDSIFAIFIGINDVGNSWWQDRVINKKIFAVYGGLLEMLYNAGAKNFVLLNVPPVDRSPLTLAQTAENQASEKADITAFNSAVADMAKSVKKAHGDVNVFTVDTNKVFTQVLDKPSSYKATALYKNTTAYCDAYANGTPTTDYFDASCGVPVNQYFWLNSLHPTYPMHDVLAEAVASTLETGPNVC